MNNTKKTTRLILLLLMLVMQVGPALAQVVNLVQGKITSATDGSELIGATVSEFDANNRVVSSTATDVNGHYVLKAKDMNNTISVTIIGFTKQTKRIAGQKTINFVLQESSHMITEVVVKATKKRSENGYSIPQREIGSAMQTLDAKEFEGLQVTSVDEALQGRIAGLDIVANSGDPGSGSSMRIRGVTSITGSSEPLIVLNGIPYTAQTDKNFDYANSNQEQYANMLSINPDDIQDITVLKDAGASAIWGSRGANGVIMITTKKGTAGKVKWDYSYRRTRTVQPQGLKMLNGNDFTMLMKQAYLNRNFDDNSTDVDEYNYDKNFADYENFNNNTDWVKEVTQVGNINDQYLTVSGGGDRAIYRVSAGFFDQKGTVIGQRLKRFSSRSSLEYAVSDRMKFVAEFSLTNSDNLRNYDNLLGIAYKKMPNVSVYAQDSLGNNTGTFYNIPSSSVLSTDQKNLKNPVALARLATNRSQSLRIIPTLRLNYDILDPKVTSLKYSMYVSLDISNSNNNTFLPQEVSNAIWNNTSVNLATYSDNESVQISTEQNIAWQPKLANPDHSFLLYGSFQMSSGNSSGQGVTSYSLPSSQAQDPTVLATLSGASTGFGRWRSLAYMVRSHYSYKSRYILDLNWRRDGTTKFGDGSKFGDFPSLNAKWIISDEPFMEEYKNVISMLAVRPAWGISGNQPGSEGLQYARYKLLGTYLDEPAMVPSNLQLKNLKWETTSSMNYGLDLGLLKDTYVFDLNFYHKKTSDLLFPNVGLPASSGYNSISYLNAGTMENNGWEININAFKCLKVGKFSMDFRLNLANYYNKLIDLDENLLSSFNATYGYNNGAYLTRIQENNSFGSIYGFRYKGVYQYDKYEVGMNGTAPVAKDEFGNVITDQDGKPKAMYFNYYEKEGKTRYQFRGGDAMYEDINHDGTIDELDIVYLGNCNPKLNGGFGPTFRYKDFTCNLFFTFRYGNKTINMARMNAENMYYDNNQSVAVNWRWRKDGDQTEIPRALHNDGYNWLGSDRYVEDASFLRFKYLQFSYNVPSTFLKPYGLKRLNAYLNFNNLAVWSKYTGVDPEVGYGTLTDGSQGLSIDNSQTPRTKDITLGISIGL